MWRSLAVFMQCYPTTGHTRKFVKYYVMMLTHEAWANLLGTIKNYTEAMNIPMILSGESTDGSLLPAPCWRDHTLQVELITGGGFRRQNKIWVLYDWNIAFLTCPSCMQSQTWGNYQNCSGIVFHLKFASATVMKLLERFPALKEKKKKP